MNGELNSLALAYIGDAVYELRVREYLISKNICKVNELQKESIKFVSAKGQYQILTNDGLTMVTSSYDTKLIDDKTSKLSAEDIARSIIGNDVKITYLDEIAKSK